MNHCSSQMTRKGKKMLKEWSDWKHRLVKLCQTKQRVNFNPKESNMKWLQTEHLWLERYDFSFSQSKTKVTSDEWKWFKKQAGLRMLTGKSLTWQVWVVWGLLLDWGVLVVGTSRLADTSKPPTTIITAFPVNCTRTAMSRKNNETPRNPCYAQRLSLHLSLSVPIAPKMQCQELTKHKQTPRNLLLCFAHQCTSCFPL